MERYQAYHKYYHKSKSKKRNAGVDHANLLALDKEDKGPCWPATGVTNFPNIDHVVPPLVLRSTRRCSTARCGWLCVVYVCLVRCV